MKRSIESNILFDQRRPSMDGFVVEQQQGQPWKKSRVCAASTLAEITPTSMTKNHYCPISDESAENVSSAPRNTDCHSDSQMYPNASRAFNPKIVHPLSPPVRHQMPTAMIPNARFKRLIEREGSYTPFPSSSKPYPRERKNNVYYIKLGRHIVLQKKIPEIFRMLRELTCRLQYCTETMYMACYYFDKCMSTKYMRITKQRYLCAFACYFIASKIVEETREPVLTTFVSHCSKLIREENLECVFAVSNGATDVMHVEEMKRMERKVFETLDWQLDIVTPHAILDEIFSSLGTANNRHHAQVTSSLYPCDAPCYIVPCDTTRICVFRYLDKIIFHIMNGLTAFYWRPSVIICLILDHLIQHGYIVGNSSLCLASTYLSSLRCDAHEIVNSFVFSC